MYRWYADDCAFRKGHGAFEDQVFLFGGIFLSRKNEITLSAKMKEIKREYAFEDMPIKYNMRDLRQVYKKFRRINEFNKLLKASKIWRKLLLQKSLNFEYRIFISCIENFQSHKKKQGKIKENISSFLFGNALMRVGIHSTDISADHVQTILDWPEGNLARPFDKEYYYAYNRGTNSDGQEYYCGPLKDINFDQTLFYARSNHSNILQFSDIILGILRDWLENYINNHEDNDNIELVKLIIPRLYGYPRRIMGYGINVSSRNQDLKNDIQKAINKDVA